MLVSPLFIHAKMQQERRVYYLDCSYSMVVNNIWDEVCNNLKKAIDNIPDETTEIVVVPFATNHDGSLKIVEDKATPTGKKRLKDAISAIEPNKASMTYHYRPIEDFYNIRVNPEKITYMFLMTDGQDEYHDKSRFIGMIKRWESLFGNQNVYGFYVMLHQSAQNKIIEDICKTQKHLWAVKTADINVNLIRIENNTIYNVRNDKYIDLNVYGFIKSIQLTANFDKDALYKVQKTSIVNGKLRVFVCPIIDAHLLPESKEFPLYITMKGGDKYDILVTDAVNVKCERKKERSLKISIK